MIIVIKDAFDGMLFPEAGDYGEAHTNREGYTVICSLFTLGTSIRCHSDILFHNTCSNEYDAN